MRVFAGRRPELMLLAALVVFATALAGRTIFEQAPSQVAINTSAPAPAALEAGDEQIIARLQERIRRNPEDTAAYAQLGLALLQRVRETADPGLYTQAGQAFDEALKRDPQHLDALVGQGVLALARHHFADALVWGERARTLNPFRAQIYGIIGDAQVELGRYDEALTSIQKMVDTRPDLHSYSRVSYQRELHGDMAGAIVAMRQAVKAGAPGMESTLWTQVQLGHLFFNTGDLQQAERMYQEALYARPDYVYAQAGLARVAAARGQSVQAIDQYRQIVERMPLPEFVIALGELYELHGQPNEAKTQYDLVRAMQQLNAAAGMDVDMELALFDADHGADPAQAVTRARAAYERRPSIYAADALAWALYQAGNTAEAARYSSEALRLGTRDAALHYRAGVIANALSDHDTARRELALALEINPYFSVRYAPHARELLGQLSKS